MSSATTVSSGNAASTAAKSGWTVALPSCTTIQPARHPSTPATGTIFIILAPSQAPALSRLPPSPPATYACPMTERIEADVAVVGAGIAGLVAARELVAAGKEVVV